MGIRVGTTQSVLDVFPPTDSTDESHLPPDHLVHVRIAKARAGGVQTTGSTNDDRDAWMHAQKRDGKTHSEILGALKKEHTEWDFIDSVQGVGRAIDRYCDRKRLPLLRRKKPKKR